METRKLGRTGLEVSLLTFGCGAVGGLMTKGEAADQMRAVRAALDLGINFFDTAPTYGNTASETNLGRILTELKPDIVLGTKVRFLPGEKDNIEAVVAASIEDSLRRLRRDHVDLFQLHNPITAAAEGEDLTPEQVLEEVVPAFEKIMRQGKVRFTGITAVGDTAALLKVVDSGAFDTAQIVYNLLNPSAGEPVGPGYPGQDYQGLLGRATAAGMGSIVIRTLAGGALSGSEARHPLGMPVVVPIGSGEDYATDVARARRMAPAAAKSDNPDLVELAIRYVAGHPQVSTLQVGIATVEQFEGAAAAVKKGTLAPGVLEEIGRVQAEFETEGRT